MGYPSAFPSMKVTPPGVPAVNSDAFQNDRLPPHAWRMGDAQGDILPTTASLAVLAETEALSSTRRRLQSVSPFMCDLQSSAAVMNDEHI